MTSLGSYMRKLDPAFDPRSFGHRNLSALIKSQPKSFETRTLYLGRMPESGKVTLKAQEKERTLRQ